MLYNDRVQVQTFPYHTCKVVSYQYTCFVIQRTRSGNTILSEDRVQVKTFPCHTDKVVISKVLH